MTQTQVDRTDLDEKLAAAVESVRRTSEIMIALGHALADIMRPTVEAMNAFAVEFDARVQAAYRAAGEPRGPGSENAWVWFRTASGVALAEARDALDATPTPAEPSPPPRPAPPHQPAP